MYYSSQIWLDLLCDAGFIPWAWRSLLWWGLSIEELTWTLRWIFLLAPWHIRYLLVGDPHTRMACSVLSAKQFLKDREIGLLASRFVPHSLLKNHLKIGRSQTIHALQHCIEAELRHKITAPARGKMASQNLLYADVQYSLWLNMNTQPKLLVDPNFAKNIWCGMMRGSCCLLGQVPGGKLEVLKKQAMERCVDVLGTYRSKCATASATGQLILPETLKLLPLYILALIKTPAFRWVQQEVQEQFTANFVLWKSLHLHDTHTCGLQVTVKALRCTWGLIYETALYCAY